MIERTRNLSSSENSIPSGQTVEVNQGERIAAREYWVGVGVSSPPYGRAYQTKADYTPSCRVPWKRSALLSHT